MKIGSGFGLRRPLGLPSLLLLVYFVFELVFLIGQLPTRTHPTPPQTSSALLLDDDELDDQAKKNNKRIQELQTLIGEQIRLRKGYERVGRFKALLAKDAKRFLRAREVVSNLTRLSEEAATKCTQLMEQALQLSEKEVSNTRIGRLAKELKDWESRISHVIQLTREETLRDSLSKDFGIKNYQRKNSAEVYQDKELEQFKLREDEAFPSSSYPNINFLRLRRSKEEIEEQDPVRIVGLSGVRNAVLQLPHFLSSLSKLVDSIILLDDASDDGTFELAAYLLKISRPTYSEHQFQDQRKEGRGAEFKLEAVIRKEVWRRDETLDKSLLLRLGREVAKGTHFVYLDYDESFADSCHSSSSSNFVLRKEIQRLHPGFQLKLEWVLFWDGLESYRKGFLNREIITIFADDPNVPSLSVPTIKKSSVQLHTKRLPAGFHFGPVVDHTNVTSCKILEFRFLNIDNTRLKEAWYYALGVVRGNYRATTPGYSNQYLSVSKDSKDNEETGENNKEQEDNEEENEKEEELTPVDSLWLGGDGRLKAFGDAMEEIESWRAVEVLRWLSIYGKEFFPDYLDRFWVIDWLKLEQQLLTSGRIQTLPLQVAISSANSSSSSSSLSNNEVYDYNSNSLGSDSDSDSDSDSYSDEDQDE